MSLQSQMKLLPHVLYSLDRKPPPYTMELRGMKQELKRVSCEAFLSYTSGKILSFCHDLPPIFETIFIKHGIIIQAMLHLLAIEAVKYVPPDQ